MKLGHDFEFVAALAFGVVSKPTIAPQATNAMPTLLAVLFWREYDTRTIKYIVPSNKLARNYRPMPSEKRAINFHKLGSDSGQPANVLAFASGLDPLPLQSWVIVCAFPLCKKRLCINVGQAI